MATSGLYTYSIQRDALISASFRLLGVFNDDSPAPTTDLSNAAQALNLMIKQWMADGCTLWTVADMVLPMTAGKSAYAIGPSGDLVSYRPLRVLSARLAYANGLEVPLQPMSKDDYMRMGNKSSPGAPNSYFYDPQLGNGVLNLYVTPDTTQTSNTIKLVVQRPLMDMSSGTQDFDFPVECLNAIKYGLASELVDEYDVPENKAARIIGRAQALKEGLFDFSQENNSVFFSVGSR